MPGFLVGYFYGRFHGTPTTLMSCSVPMTHPHDTLRMYWSMGSNRDHWYKETTLLPLGGFRGEKPVKEMVDRSEASITTIAICVASGGQK